MRYCLGMLLMLLAACAPQGDATLHLHGVSWYADSGVVLAPVEESVVPVNVASVPERAVVLPFVLEGEARHRRAISVGLTGTLCDVWRRLRVFPALEFDADTRVSSREEALTWARTKGATVLVTGRLHPVLVGGGLGRTEIGVQVEAVWVATGQTYWSASQAGVLEGAPVRDYVVVRRAERLPRHPEVAVMAAIAKSLGQAYLAHGEEMP